MRPKAIHETLEKVWSLAAEAFPSSLINGAKKAFIAEHIREGGGTPTVFTATCFRKEGEIYWLSALQRGGGLQIFVWVPNYQDKEVLGRAEHLVVYLKGSVATAAFDVRYGEPHKLAKFYGQPISGGC